MNSNLDSCCSEKRAALGSRPATESPSYSANVTRLNTSVPVAFEYIGATALTVVGPMTGKRYRFKSPGARAKVDGRDAFSLATVPVLQRVRD